MNEIIGVMVVGERHTGVNDVLRNLNHHLLNLTVSPGVSRNRYWFQTEESFLRMLPQTKEELSSFRQGSYLNRMLVLVVTRSPYEWMLAMQKQPIHAPNHYFPSLKSDNLQYDDKRNWKKFVSKPWTIKTSEQDQTIASTEGARCQEKFSAGEVLPCRKHDSVVLTILDSLQKRMKSTVEVDKLSTIGYPVYETHVKDHRPFKNIAELRRAKMINYYNMTAWVKNLKFIQIESLLASSVGSENLEPGHRSQIQARKFNVLLRFLHEKYGIGVCLAEEGVDSQKGNSDGKSAYGRIQFSELSESIPKADYNFFSSLPFNQTKQSSKKKSSQNSFRRLKTVHSSSTKRGKESKNSSSAGEVQGFTSHTMIPESIVRRYNFLRWLTCNVHWRIEAKFGYQKMKNLLYDVPGLGTEINFKTWKMRKKIRCNANPYDSKFSVKVRAAPSSTALNNRRSMKANNHRQKALPISIADIAM